MDKLPQTVAEEVGRGVNALLAESSDRYQDWNGAKVLNLRHSIDQLQKIDAPAAFNMRGQLAAICGNIPEVLESYRRALQHPDQATTKHEFWAAFGNLALYAEAQEIAVWLLEPRRGFFPKAWERAFYLGLPLTVKSKMGDAIRSWPDLRDANFSVLEKTTSVMAARGLTDDAIVKVMSLMGEVQREHRIMFFGDHVTNLKVMTPSEEPPYLYMAVPLKASVEEIHVMNRELTKLVVRKLPHGAFPDGLVMSFEKAPIAELRAAA